MKTNKQYSYMTRESITLSFGKPGWLLLKDGQTIEQSVEERVKQQKNASSLSTPIIVNQFSIDNNDDVKLDDKIRAEMFKTDYHQGYNYLEVGGGREWTYTFVQDIYDELNMNPTQPDDILNNELFIEKLGNRIQDSKALAVGNILGQSIHKTLVLRPWQQQVVDQMLSSNQNYILLSLPPRFGKTLSVLEYTKKLVENGLDGNKLYLVPLSKNLSSNASFVVDYDDFGYSQYYNILKDISLFKDEEKIIEKLSNELPDDALIIPITDEADLASNTSISISKINEVISKYQVVKQIVMTGTNVGRAAKILKDIPMEDINYIHMTYTDMLVMGGDVVKRNVINAQYNISDFSEDVLNIRQSFEDPKEYQTLSKYLHTWTLDSGQEMRYNLQPTEAVMVFIKTKTKKHLKQFGEVFYNNYSDECEVMVITGDFTTNGKAQQQVKEKLHIMKQNNNNKRLIILSNGMASRSFSVSKIYRTILFGDNLLSYADLQAMSRSLTFEDGKEFADIIRIGFSEFDVASQLFMLENETIDYSDESNKKVGMFLSTSSFVNVVIEENGNQQYTTLGNQQQDIMEFIDNTTRFTDNTSYILTKLFDIGIEVDTEREKQKSTKTRVVSTSVKKLGKSIKPNKSGKLIKEDERKLRQYINIFRCLPSIAGMEGYTNVEDYLNSDSWDLEISKELFKKNYEVQEFKGQVDALFRQTEKWTTEQHKERLIDYMKYIGF
jgi:Icc-related predicted phosphoesterase